MAKMTKQLKLQALSVFCHFLKFKTYANKTISLVVTTVLQRLINRHFVINENPYSKIPETSTQTR